MSARLKPGLASGLSWLALAAPTVICVGGLRLVEMPGAVVLGSIAAAVGVAMSGPAPALPRNSVHVSQSLLGASLGGMLAPSMFEDIAINWLPMLATLVTMMGTAVLVGWLLELSRRLPIGTGTWGSLPGAASAMVMLADEYGGDIRFVALMQYMRVLVVVLVAAFVSHALAGAVGVVPPAVPSSPIPTTQPALGFLVALAVAGSGAWAGLSLRMPAGALLGPMALGGAISIAGLAPIHFPQWFTWGIYVLIGWTIGLRFRRQIMGELMAALPLMLISIFALVGLSAISALVLIRLTGLDPLTAFLATSPGGIDSVAILALESKADVPFVLALQTLRVFATILAGTLIARRLARRRRMP